uniref:Putative mismatch repair endonuclease pms2 n=1 Tax=Ixodes ricinus TaxID=34613 RepID=A0A0K8RCW5_IXORI
MFVAIHSLHVLEKTPLQSGRMAKLTRMPHCRSSMGYSFQGWCNSPRWLTTLPMVANVNGMPTMTDLRQALDANIWRTLDGRHTVCGLSLSMKMSSSTSSLPN